MRYWPVAYQTHNRRAVLYACLYNRRAVLYACLHGTWASLAGTHAMAAAEQ